MEACGKFIGSQVMRQIMGPIIGSGSLHPCGTGWYFKSAKTKQAIKNDWPCLQDGGYKGTLFVVPLTGFLGAGYFLWLTAFFVFGKDDARLYAIAEKADDADKKTGQEMLCAYQLSLLVVDVVSNSHCLKRGRVTNRL